MEEKCRDCHNTLDMPSIYITVSATKSVLFSSDKSVSRMGTISSGNLFTRKDTIPRCETRTGV